MIATRMTLARLLLRRLTIASFIAGLALGVVFGYVWKTMEVSL